MYSTIQAYDRIHVIDDSISENSFTVEWTLDNKAETPMVLNLLWRQENKIHWNSVSIPPNDTMFSLHGLQHGTKYEVKLLLRRTKEHATESDIIKTQTKNSS
ncbi:hypothetical protein DPMN_027256 [Dreissena polymorpha]|uniref:Fibronectin type-III domain-containing protein n=1 Tax=Dreissena polymorpha TaxID=45954 RepID=A0A9D4RFB9_DREPO|nr:hypothetical protein DPMN_027256 [Dreissena polymorpha]